MGMFGSGKPKTVQPIPGTREDIARLLPERPVPYVLPSYAKAAKFLSDRLPADEGCIELVTCGHVTRAGSWDGVLVMTSDRLVVCLVNNDPKSSNDIVRAVPLAEANIRAGKDPVTQKYFITVAFGSEEYLLTATGGKAPHTALLDAPIDSYQPVPDLATLTTFSK